MRWLECPAPSQLPESTGGGGEGGDGGRGGGIFKWQVGKWPREPAVVLVVLSIIDCCVTDLPSGLKPQSTPLMILRGHWAQRGTSPRGVS